MRSHLFWKDLVSHVRQQIIQPGKESHAPKSQKQTLATKLYAAQREPNLETRVVRKKKLRMKRGVKGWKEKKKTPTTQRWRLLGSPAENNETHVLELLGAWEPTCSGCTLTLSVGKSSQNFVSNGNKTILRRDEVDSE